MERLHKLLAHAGIASRRAAERLISAGRVSVNGSVVTVLGTRVDPQEDVVRVDGKRVRQPPSEHTYLMLNKPRGYVTTLHDPQERPTVRDLLRGVKRRVYPVGRLDYASEGLLLLTDDGQLARDLMHPTRRVPKTYRVKVRGRPDSVALERLARGVIVDGRPTLPAQVRVVGREDNAWLEVSVIEGRKHHLRKMLQVVGHPVMKLRRVAYGGVRLGALRSGTLRPLTPLELTRLRRAVASSDAPPTRVSS